MRFLLDVNALVALGFLQHEFHQRVANWVRTLRVRQALELLTCSITELGFVRVLAQASQYGFTVSHARAQLLGLKTGNIVKFAFIPDDHDISQLPSWAKSAKQTTNGHLAALAKSNGAVLATLDQKIPRAFFIPADK
jgi:predicted nucleic acid-binding protein